MDDFSISLPEWRTCDNCTSRKVYPNEVTGSFYCDRKKMPKKLGVATWCKEFYPKREYARLEHDFLVESLFEFREKAFNDSLKK
jgi:hypothetical protein